MSESTLSIQLIDPSTLLVDVNIRTDNALDKTFLGSVRDLGVLVPIVAVRTPDGALRVKFGHRRTMAAVETGKASVPVVITGEDDADDVARIVSQWHENEHRAGLTTADKLAAVEQLSLLGLSAGQIIKRTKAAKGEVEAALAATASELAKGATGRYEFLTLTEAAGVAEFEDDREVVKTLVAAAKQSEGDFAHALQRARDARDEAAAVAALLERLTAEGTRIIQAPEYGDRTARRVTALADADGTRLTVEGHAGCPGHAAFVRSTWQGIEAVHVCTDWKANGHRDPDAGNGARPAGTMSDAEKAQRRTVIENNKAWRSGEIVRREWLTQFLTRKTAPKGAAVYVASELGHGPSSLSDALSKANGLAATLLGADGSHSRSSVAALAAAATDARAQVIGLGVVLAAVERATNVDSWRNVDPATARYLTFLAEQGYALSDVEKLAAGIKPRRAKRGQTTPAPSTADAVSAEQAAA